MEILWTRRRYIKCGSPIRVDGTYTNPILYTDYSDPDAIRVGEDYFMIASSCNTPQFLCYIQGSCELEGHQLHHG